MKQSKENPLRLPFSPVGGANSDTIDTTPNVEISAIEKWLLRKLIKSLGNPPLRILLWSGEELFRTAPKPRSGLIIHNRAALWRLLSNPGLRFGDEYCNGGVDVEGGLVRFVETLQEVKPLPSESTHLERLMMGFLSHPRRNTPIDSKKNIYHHYDIGNEFYRLWLDRDLQYTCAYFPDPTMTLEAAQAAKVDHVCRKLRLKPGEHVVEAGCGWGGTALHMAKHYGVNVTACNISHEQVVEARRRARVAGLERQVEFIEDDYRNISGRFDAFVSIGMLEHVGVDHYRELGEVINHCLTPHGRGLIHSIGQPQSEPLNAWIEKRIFPGAYPPTLRQMLEVLEPRGFAVQDVENLRLHYAKTITHWLVRFEQHADEIERMFDAAFVRAWRFYLSSSTASFNSGALQLFQVLFTRPGNKELPWSRAHLYATPAAAY